MHVGLSRVTFPLVAPPRKDSDLPRRLKDGTYLHKYGYCATLPHPEWMVELKCFQLNWSPKEGGLGAYRHLKNAAEVLCPELVHHPWREWRWRTLCDDDYATRIGSTIVRNHSWVGCAASGKTVDAGGFGFLWWLADPANTSVILTSTSKDKIRQRVWPTIQACWSTAEQVMCEQGGVTGPHMLNSMLQLQCEKGNYKSSIFAQAVEAGEVAKAVERIKGVHNARIMLVIDEAPGTEDAIWSCIPNALKGCREFILVSIGNGPTTHLDTFSKVCKPAVGWGSVTVNDDEWRTNAVPEFQLPGGVCLHHDGFKSPNVVAKKTLYPFLYSYEDYQRVSSNDTIQRTLTCWANDRGFWAPEGFSNTVLSEELIERGNARGVIEFSGPTTPIGGIDPGFGGDECVCYWGRLGRRASGHWCVQLDARQVVPILVDALDDKGKKLPAEYQIAEWVQREAAARKVDPRHFGVEASGTGRGVAAVLTQEWGPVLAVESGGKPSELPASEEDPRPAHQVYDRRVSELWYSVQAFVRNGQLGGLDEHAIIDLCSRTYEVVNRKTIVEQKVDLKARLGHSPDSGDAVAIVLEVARARMGAHTEGPMHERQDRAWDQVVRAQNRVYARAWYGEEAAPA